MKALLALLVLSISFSSQALTLDEYLMEVQKNNGAVKSVEKSAEAKALRLGEASLFFKPSFFLNGEYSDDQRPTNAPSFQGTQTLRHTLRSGFNQNLRTGTKATLSYNIFKTQINGALPSVLPRNRFYDVAPQLEISQSLWRNFLGSENEAAEKVQLSQVEASRLADQFTAKQLLIQAENAYWRLHFAQISLRVQEESLERAKRLRDWNARRVRNNLVDEGDLLQAESNLHAREIEYQDTLAEIDSAMKEFNSIREGNGDVDLTQVVAPDSSYILNAPVPAKAPLREDVLIALENQKIATANSLLGTERNRPNLEVYGSYSINGRDLNYTDAYSQAATATRPYSIVGVRFTTPLDVKSLSEFKRAYAQEKVAAEMSYKRKAFEVDREWEILSERFNNFKKRLALAQKREEIEKRKLSTEKNRYNQGRTTTFQVLQFEQDFANAQLLKLRFERELLTVYNQLKLFSGVHHDQQ